MTTETMVQTCELCGDATVTTDDQTGRALCAACTESAAVRRGKWWARLLDGAMEPARRFLIGRRAAD